MTTTTTRADIDAAAAELVAAEAAYHDALEIPEVHPYAVAQLGHQAAEAYARYVATVEAWRPPRRQFADEPRCAVCGRDAHAAGTWQGHWYQAPTAPAMPAELAERVTA